MAQLAYIYFEGRAEPPLRAKLLTRDEASRIAANVVKLPEFCNESDAAIHHFGGAGALRFVCGARRCPKQQDHRSALNVGYFRSDAK